MADNTPQAASTTSDSSTTTEQTFKWKPYWDKHYNRYYWSNGKESVWETPKGCIEPPPISELSSNTEQEQYTTSDYSLFMMLTSSQSNIRYQPNITPGTIDTGEKLVIGQHFRKSRRLYRSFDYNAWNEELNRTNGSQKKKVKLPKKKLDAIKTRRAEIKRKHRNKWLLDG